MHSDARPGFPYSRISTCSIEIWPHIVAVIRLVLDTDQSTSTLQDTPEAFSTYLATRKDVVRSAALVTLQILEINKLSLSGAIGNGLWALVLPSAGVRHEAVIISAVGMSRSRTPSGSLVDTAIRARGMVGDVRGLVESRRIEGVQGRQGQRPHGPQDQTEKAHVDTGRVARSIG